MFVSALISPSGNEALMCRRSSKDRLSLISPADILEELGVCSVSPFEMSELSV